MTNITPTYQHTAYGKFMFNLCAKWTVFICKHKWLYYTLACTWGVLLTAYGLICTIICGIAKCFGAKVQFKKYNWLYAISIGPDYWGGAEAGLMFFRDQKSAGTLDAHEFGHSIQNTLLGPFFLVLVWIPSAIRWWCRALVKKPGRAPYNSMWFEDSATNCGVYADELIKTLYN